MDLARLGEGLLRRVTFGAALAAAVVMSVACGDDGAECTDGTEGCACYANKTCNDGLSCLSNLCVDADEKPGKGKSDGDGGGKTRDSGVDPDDTPNSRGDGGEPNADETKSGPGGANSDDTNNPDDTDETSGSGFGAAPKGSPVDKHGALRVVGSKLVDKSGKSVQLKGVSSMWLNWENDGFAEDKAGLTFMRDNWNLSLIRVAMGVEAHDDSPTYLADPEHATAQVEKIVENAIEVGVYVIIDWHDHEAIAHQAQAEAFFTKMARKYGKVPNVLYEVFNEPDQGERDENGDRIAGTRAETWTELKAYHAALRDTIRAEDPDNVIILGTPNWDQDVDVAASSPVSGDNLMYALHFYSCTHTTYPYLDKAQAALNAGLPLFVSEWGAATADGNQTTSTCIAEAASWHDWMDDNGISWAAWKLDNCSDATCFFPAKMTKTNGGWETSELNGLHPEFAVSRMKATYTPVVVDPDPDPDPGPTGCTPSGTCADGNAMDCDAEGEAVEADCTPCALLSCGTECCDRVGVFGAYVTEYFYDYFDAPELVAEYGASAENVSLSAEFDTTIPGWFQQFAVHSFRFTESKDILDAADTEVCLETDQIDMVGFTFENGSDGCAVTITSIGAGCYAPREIDNCWGAWQASGTIGSWIQLNVRTMATQYSSDFSTSLTVTSVSVP